MKKFFKVRAENTIKYICAKDINEAAQIGDYAGALNTDIRTAGNIMQDTQLISRMKASAEFQDKVDEVHKMKANGNIDAATEKWWLENNQFKYEDIYDTDGNIVSGTTYSTLPTPVTQINLPEFIAKAYQMNTSEKTSYENFNSDGSITRGGTDKVTYKTIADGTKELLNKTTGAMESLKQDYEVAKYNNDPFLDLNGSTMSFEQYLNKRIGMDINKNPNELIRNLSYFYSDEQTVKYKGTNNGKGNGDGSGNEDGSGNGAGSNYTVFDGGNYVYVDGITTGLSFGVNKSIYSLFNRIGL